MNKKHSIIVTSAAGVVLLALGFVYREAICRTVKKVINKARRSPASEEEIPQEAEA